MREPDNTMPLLQPNVEIIMKIAIIAAPVLLAGWQAIAQDYPTRPITMIVPTGPGGGMETLARIFSRLFSFGK